MNDLVSVLTKIGAPVLASAIGGPFGSLASIALGALADALGTQPTPEAVTDALNTNPDAKDIALRVETARKDDLAELQARLADVADARAMQNHAVDSGSWTAAMPAVQTAFNYVVAFAVVVCVAKGWLREDGIVVGFGIGAYATSNNFWLGSSSGSKRSGDAVRAIAQQASPSVGQVAGKVVDAVIKGKR